MSRFDWNEIFFSTNGSFQSFFWGHESHAASTCGKLHLFFPTVIEVICLGGLTYVMAEFFALGPQWVGWIFPLNLLDHVDRMQNAETILGFMFQWSFLGGNCPWQFERRCNTRKFAWFPCRKWGKTLKLLKLSVFIWKNPDSPPETTNLNDLKSAALAHLGGGKPLNWWLVDFSFKNNMYWGILGKWQATFSVGLVWRGLEYL